MRLSPAVAAAAALTGQALASPSPSHQKETLDSLAKRAGKEWFGTAADIPHTEETTDAAYLTILAREFGEITPANALKFMYTEQGPNFFNFSDGEYIVSLAEREHKSVHCHTLVWVNQLSDWVTERNWTAEGLTAVMKNHIYRTVQHFGTRCEAWDVVNEAFNSDGTFSSSIWYDTIGEEYIYLAFQYARDALEQIHARKVDLYYNDYGIENAGPKVDAVLRLVKGLRRRGLRIDGVGLQSHFTVGGTPSLADQIATKKAYIKADLDVLITELDVRFTEEPFYTAEGQRLQAAGYYDSVASCVNVGRRCTGIIVWDFADEYSWVPYTFEGQGGAALYNDTLEAKPAYYAVADALKGKPCSVC